MANINSNKIEEINRWFSERKQNENPTNYEYYIETLKDLKNLNISDEYTLNQINTLLIKLSKANDFYTISEIMDELETIKEKFENDKLEIRDDSRNQRENIENENPFANLDPFAYKDPVNIVQSPEYQESETVVIPVNSPEEQIAAEKLKEQEKKALERLLAHDFNWKKSPEEVKEEVDEIIRKIETGKILTGLTSEQREVIKQSLLDIIGSLKDAETWAMKKVQVGIEGLRDKVNVNKDWTAYITLKDENGNDITAKFKNKAEAYEKISELKSIAERQLQSFFQNRFEDLIDFVDNSYFLAWRGEAKSWSYVYNSGLEILYPKDGRDVWDWANLVASLVLLVWYTSLFIWTHDSAYKSFKRRVIDDFIRARDQSDRNIVFEDYYKVSSWPKWLIEGNQISSPDWKNYDSSSSEFQDYLTYKERVRQLDYIRTLRDSYHPGTEEYKKYSKWLTKLERYYMNKTNTFEFVTASLILRDWDPLWKFATNLHNTFFKEWFFPIIPNLKKSQSWWRIRNLFSAEGWRLHKRSIPIQDIRRNVIDMLSSKVEDRASEYQELYWEEIKFTHLENGVWFEVKYKNWNGVVDLNKIKESKYYNWVLNYLNELPEWTDDEKKSKENKISEFNKYIESLTKFPKSPEVVKFDLYKISNWYLLPNSAAEIVRNRINSIKSSQSYRNLFSLKKGSTLGIKIPFSDRWIWFELNILDRLLTSVKEWRSVYTKDELNKIIENLEKRKFPWVNIKENVSEVYENSNFDDIMRTWEAIDSAKKEFKKYLEENNKWEKINLYIDYIVSDDKEMEKRELFKNLSENSFLKSIDSYKEKLAEILDCNDVNDIETKLNSIKIENSYKLNFEGKTVDEIKKYINKEYWIEQISDPKLKSHIEREIGHLAYAIESWNKFLKWQLTYIIEWFLRWFTYNSYKNMDWNDSWIDFGKDWGKLKSSLGKNWEIKLSSENISLNDMKQKRNEFEAEFNNNNTPEEKEEVLKKYLIELYGNTETKWITTDLLKDKKNNIFSLEKGNFLNRKSVDDLKGELDKRLDKYFKNKETKPEEVLNYIAETKDNPWKWPERLENLKKYFENKYGKEDFKKLYRKILEGYRSNNTFNFSIEENGKKIEQEDQKLFEEYVIERYNSFDTFKNLDRKEVEKLSKLDITNRNDIIQEIISINRDKNLTEEEQRRKIEEQRREIVKSRIR